MNSTVFAAHAAAFLPISASAPETGSEPVQKSRDGLLNQQLSADIRTLIALHDRNRLTAFEARDESHKALLDLAKYLRATPGIHRNDGIQQEILAQAVKFIKSVPAQQVFIRLEVTNKRPQVPDFNPAHMCAYDAERAYGTDYLQIARRLTFFGSTSTVMADTDLGALLESGKKKCVVLYVGTQKNDDVQFLDPSCSMALDLVVAGLEQHEDPGLLEAKAAVVASHPELARLHEETAALQILLTDFRNTLDADAGNTLTDRLLDLRNTVEGVPVTDQTEEFLSPVAEAIDHLLADDMVKEILALREISAPAAPEIDAIYNAVEAIITNPLLSSEERGSEILALLRQEFPTLRATPTLTEVQLATCLQHIQDRLADSDISLGMPLTVLPQSWTYSHSEELAAIINVLSAANADLQTSLSSLPAGENLLHVLDSLSAALPLAEESNETLVASIHQALTAPSPETAQVAANLLQILNVTSNPTLIEALPVPLQLAVTEFTRESLPAQLGLIVAKLPETLVSLDHRIDQVEFRPLQILSTTESQIALPFLVPPVASESLDTRLPPQLTQLIETLALPAVQDQLRANPATAPLVAAITTLQTPEGVLPPDLSVRLAEQLASPDPAVSAPARELLTLVQTVTTAPELRVTLPPEIQSVLTQLVSPTASVSSADPALPQQATLLNTNDTASVLERLRENPSTAPLTATIATLRTPEGALPPDLSVRLAEQLASPDPAVSAPARELLALVQTVTTAPELRATLPPEIQSVLTQLVSPPAPVSSSDPAPQLAATIATLHTSEKMAPSAPAIPERHVSLSPSFLPVTPAVSDKDRLFFPALAGREVARFPCA